MALMLFSNKNRPLFLFLLLITFLTFYLLRPLEITYFDDNHIVLENETFLKTAPLKAIWSRNVMISNAIESNYFRPLLTLSFMLDARRTPFSITTFYNTNLFLHLTNLCLFYLILTFLSSSPPIKIFFTSLLALHPAWAMAVTWIPGRNDTLLTVFSLLATLFLLQYYRTLKVPYFFLHLIAFIFALGTKETALTLPLIWLLLGLTRKNLLPFWVAICLGYLVQLVSSNTSVLWPNLFTSITAAIAYFGYLTLPVNLPLIPALVDVSPFIFVFGLACIWFMFHTKYFHALLTLIILIFPTLMTLQNSQSFLLLHRLYLPFTFFLISLSRYRPKLISPSHFLIPGLFLVLLINQLNLIKNSASFWEHASRNSPHVAAVWVNKAALEIKNNDLSAGQISLNTAESLNQNVKYLNANLANLYLKKANFLEAKKYAETEVTLNPTSESWYLLGTIEAKRHDNPAAEIAFKQALKLDPTHSQSLVALIQVLYNQNKKADAEAYLDVGKNLGLEIQVQP